jgi:ATP-binding cassette subfamily B protein
MQTVIKLLPSKLKIKSFAIMIMAIAGAYLASLVPVKLGTILDGLASTPAIVKTLILPFVVLFFVVETLAIIRRVLSDRLIAQYGEVLMNESLRRLTRLPKKTLEEDGTSGEITSRVNQAIEGAVQLLKLATNDIVPTVFLGCFTIYQCFKQSTPIFAVTMLGYIICSIIASMLQIYSQKGIREGIIYKKARLNGELVQAITGIEQIRALGAEKAESKRLAPQINNIRTQESKHHTYMGMFDTIKQVLKAAFIALILFVGIQNIADGMLTGGALIAVFMLFQQLLKPVDEIYRFLDDISASLIKVKTLKRLITLKEDEIFTVEDTNPAFTENSIRIPSYKMFSTHGERKIISQGHDIVLNQGVNTAIIAKTGGGKSSLLRGLLRIYPIEGDVSFFGVNANLIPHRTLVDALHYVPQSPYFFAGTLRENLAYGLDEVSDIELIAALQQACLYNELVVDGNPLEKLLQEGGKPLSGGQAKRLAIARAFLRAPKLYLFDEVFTGIDPATLDTIFVNLDEHLKRSGAGVVHISHEQPVKDRCTVQFELDVQ